MQEIPPPVFRGALEVLYYASVLFFWSPPNTINKTTNTSIKWLK